MNIIKFCNKVIEYSFYALFFLVPLAFTDKTSELFEFNKMWVVFGFTIIIVSSWIIKMIVQRRILLCRTPLDLPLLLFLLSQFISTLFSLDMHISIWGYYSRFNGGLLSIISYILLYYAFLSNLSYLGNLIIKRVLLISLISGVVVALWGLPSHFGYDPTCLIFRGTFDVSCWTDAFQPKVRIFSTLGQPNWLATYLAILIPIAIAFAMKNLKSEIRNPRQYQNQNKKNSKQNRFENSNFKHLNLFRISIFGFSVFFLLTILFYFDLLYTNSQSGYIGFLFSIAFMAIFILLINIKNKLPRLPQPGTGGQATFSGKAGQLSTFIILFLLIAFFVGQPIKSLNKFSLPELLKSANKQTVQSIKPAEPQGPALEVGGTNSGKIRLIVWKGAIDAWKNSPIFGSGVETFAFAYYKYRPASHNLTSEWDYLYNKAHNEYLNYLATTGAFGLGTYLLMIGWFLFISLKKLNSNIEYRNPKQYQMTKIQNKKSFEHSNFENLNLFRASNFEFRILTLALIASYVSILISNFFGFSVVIVNLYMFMIPAFVFVLNNQIKLSQNNEAMKQFNNDHSRQRFNNNKISGVQWTTIFFIILTSSYLILNLFRFWSADTSYALGSNLDKVGQYDQAYVKLTEAMEKRGSEPVFRDELSFNNAALALSYIDKKDATSAAKLIKDAIETSDKVVNEHPNNLVSWKTRVRMFYMLGQFYPQYMRYALQSIIKAQELAPTDAKISYNLGVLYGQTGNTEKAIETLKNTINFKPDYRDAYYALGLFYHEAAVDKTEKVINTENQQKAVDLMNYILTKFASSDAQAKQALEKWEK